VVVIDVAVVVPLLPVCYQEKWRGDSPTLQLLLLDFLLTRRRCRRHHCRRSSSMRVKFRIPTSIGGTLFLHTLLEKGNGLNWDRLALESYK
jgi:hypothetical protein